MGSRTIPTYCDHGNVIDWGDFGPMDDTKARTCPICELEAENAKLRELLSRVRPWLPGGALGDVFRVQIDALLEPKDEPKPLEELCHGMGKYPESLPCPECAGSGDLRWRRGDKSGEKPCPKCLGSGREGA